MEKYRFYFYMGWIIVWFFILSYLKAEDVGLHLIFIMLAFILNEIIRLVDKKNIVEINIDKAEIHSGKETINDR